ncbi:DNA methyltransferase [Lactiplantibacillus plantarum]|nr:DNA methyltransferase [Lactiplantibacillus plantarum]
MPKMKTREVLDKFHISQVTLSEWSKRGGLKLNRDLRGHYIWDDESLNNLKNYIKERTAKNQGGSNETFNKLEIQIQNRRYLGAKSRLLDFIQKVVDEHTENVNSVADIFGGTGVVANHFYQQGHNIIVNDILDSNYISYLTFFGQDTVDDDKIRNILDRMNNVEVQKNYVSDNYGDKYFSKENAMKIGEARSIIEGEIGLSQRERAILMTSLIYAMDKVANTVGHYDAYRRVMDSLTPIYFRMPAYNKERKADTSIYHEDANLLVRSIMADLIYIDTPYNSRQYGDVYHVLENIVDWKMPKLYGVAMKPKDRSKTKSSYSTAKAPVVFNDLITSINAHYIMVSYNNMAQKGASRSNAKISNEEIIKILSQRGEVQVYAEDFQMFNTGKTHVDDHKELLYLVKVTR